jgi:hypothetical protein
MGSLLFLNTNFYVDMYLHSLKLVRTPRRKLQNGFIIIFEIHNRYNDNVVDFLKVFNFISHHFIGICKLKVVSIGSLVCLLSFP